MCRIAEEIKAEGRAEGRVEGRAEGKLEVVRHVMKARGLSFAQACDLLALSSEERSALKEFFQS